MEHKCDWDMEIINGQDQYYEEVLRLCDERFGTGYIDRAEYNHWMEHPELFKIGLVNGDFGGYVVMYPSEEAEISDKLDMPVTDIREIAGKKPKLYYKSAAVKKKYEHCGLIVPLTTAVLEEAYQTGYGSLFGSAWMYDGKIPLRSSLEKLGFRALYPRKMLWYGDEAYTCVICGGRCACDAMVYCREI